MSFHKGCIKDFEEVGKELGLQVYSWHIFSRPFKKFDGITKDANVYNISHERAKRIWDINKDFFNTFDVVVTSDTTPLSRIFLQNNFKKTLIIWVCNRFDYHHEVNMDCQFPDSEYYQLINKAITMDNVKIVLYTEFERIYAKKKGIIFENNIIKPIGVKEKTIDETFISKIPNHIKKEERIFLYPSRAPKEKYYYIGEQLLQKNIPFFCSPYNGPEDLKDFKGIIYFPYQASNLALFEHLQRGIIQFVPSKKFILELNNAGHSLMPFVWGSGVEYNEWYNDENKNYIIYFDSWDDLKYKIEHTDYDQMRKKIRAFGKKHRKSMLERWRNVFEKIINCKKQIS